MVVFVIVPRKPLVVNVKIVKGICFRFVFNTGSFSFQLSALDRMMIQRSVLLKIDHSVHRAKYLSINVFIYVEYVEIRLFSWYK